MNSPRKVLNKIKLLNIVIYSSIVLFLSNLSISVWGQISIPLKKIHSEIITESIEETNPKIKACQNKLFVFANNTLWIIDHDRNSVKPVKNISGRLEDVKNLENKIIIQTNTGIWSLDEDVASKIIDINKEKLSFVSTQIITLRNKLLIQTSEEDFWIFNETIGVKKINGLSGDLQNLAINNRDYIQTREGLETREGLWKLNNDYSVDEVTVPEINEKIIAIGFLDRVKFYGTDKGLWIETDGIVKKHPAITGKVNKITTHNKKIFVSVESGDSDSHNINEAPKKEWILNEEGDILKEIDYQAYRYFSDNEDFDWEYLEFKGKKREELWKFNNDGNGEKVQDFQKQLTSAPEFLAGQFIFGNTEGLWALNKGEDKIKKVTGVSGKVVFIETVDNFAYFIAPSKENKSINEIFRYDPKVRIITKLVPDSSGIQSSFINLLLVNDNWLPWGNVKADAYYSTDGEIPDPFYYQIGLKKFEFEVNENGYSQQDQFKYPLLIGVNPTVEYSVQDGYGNRFENSDKNVKYVGIPTLPIVVIFFILFFVFFLLGCFVLSPRVGFAHSAIMNPWLRKYFSFGSIPFLLSVFPFFRRYLLRRYANSINEDKEFSQWKTRFVSPSEEFLPENFGKKLNDERKLLLTGQSGIGKTVFFKYLTACYTSPDKPPLPAKVFPVYISLTNFGDGSVEDLVYNQLFSYGQITDKELAPMFLEKGGLLIFFDGVNEIQNISNRQKLSEFVERYWKSNFICLSSQQSYPEIDSIPKVELKTFDKAKVNQFIRLKVADKEKAEKAIENLTDEDYQLYSIPRDLEFAVEILNNGSDSLPKSKTGLYEIIFSLIFNEWRKNGRADDEDFLCERAYMMIATRNLTFDLVNNPKYGQITTDLFEQKFLVKREESYNFRHDLIRAFLASEYFYPRWQSLFGNIKGKVIDSNWLEMLKFSCENIDESDEIKHLMFEVLNRSIRKDIVKNLVIWIKASYPEKCKSWEKEFYTKYGELDFRVSTEEKVIMEKPRKILFVMANPLDTTKLRLDKEFKEVKRGLKLSNLRDGFDLEISTATRPNDLRQEMLSCSPQFVHFSGHGEIEGIVLEDDNGNAKVVETESLAELFSLFTDSTECVVLNSCFSENQAKAICRHIPFVVGMNRAVPDVAAIEFAIGFYDAIGAGRNIEDAFRFGKNAIDLNSIAGKDIPVLLKK